MADADLRAYARSDPLTITFPVSDAEWHAFADPIGICDEHPQPHCTTCRCVTDAGSDAATDARTDPDPGTD